jgi:hypothetical protein
MTVSKPNEDLDLALVRFAGPDEIAAADAFAVLTLHSRPILETYIGSRIFPPLLPEDVVQDVLVRLWQKRRTFEPKGWVSWICYLKRACEWSLANFTKTGSQVPFEDIEDLTSTELEQIRSLVEVGLSDEEIRFCADTILLETDPDLDTSTRSRQLLAAQMYVLEGARWDEIATLLTRSRPFAAPVTRKIFDVWLADESLLNRLIVSHLYVGGDELAGILLELPSDKQSDLTELLKLASANCATDPAPGGWTWDEVAVIILRYRNALFKDQILRLQACRLKESEFSDLTDRCVARFPFQKRMRNVVGRLGALRLRAKLGPPGLWQRLAFEYWMFDDLPNNDIMDRIKPAADEVGAKLTPGMLNVWICNERLAKRVAKFCQRTGRI